MNLFNLLEQEYFQAVRSRSFHKKVFASILLGFALLYFGGILLLLGFLLGDMLEELNEGFSPTDSFNGALFYIILLGCFLRFFLQNLSTINLTVYQTLPIKRSSLINFLILKPLFAPFNYFILLAIIPFACREVAADYDSFVALRFVINFILIIWFNSLIISWLKRTTGLKPISIIVFLLLFGLVAALDYFSIFSLFSISMQFFSFVLQHLWTSFLLLGAVVSAFILNKRFFSQNYYPEKFNKETGNENLSNLRFSFLSRYGKVGELITLQLKLILRHKRTKSILYTSVIFLFYGLLVYTNHNYNDQNGMLFFVALFMTGALMFMFGQWAIAWDSPYFDSIMTTNIPIQSYLSAQYYLFLFCNAVCFILTTPYFFFGEKIMYLHIAAFIFNSGINIFLLLFFATFNTKRIELSKGNAFNFQGVSFKQFTSVLPILLFPIIIMRILSYFTSLSTTLWILSIIGLLGLLCHKWLISICVKQFNSRKYKLAEGFREKE